jgi:hypothetical protein
MMLNIMNILRGSGRRPALLRLCGIGIASAALFFWAFSTRVVEGPVLGNALPDFTWTTLDGQTVQPGLLGFDDTVIAFIRSSCPHCRESLPDIDHFFSARSTPRLYIVSVSTPQETSGLLRDLGIKAPVFLDTKDTMRELFHSIHTPALLWYRSGRLKYKCFRKSEISELEALITGETEDHRP